MATKKRKPMKVTRGQPGIARGPKLGRAELIRVPCTPEERDSYVRAASAAGLTLAAWFRGAAALQLRDPEWVAT